MPEMPVPTRKKSDPKETLRLVVNSETPEAQPIEQAAAILQRGGLVAFPTETVYGLGANALDPDAVAGIFAAKGRPAYNPIIVHVPDTESAKAIVADWPETASRLAEHFWPGPLTLILPRGETIPPIVTAGGPTVAVRMPAHPVALALLRTAQLPIAAPSANRSTRISPTHAEHVLAGLDGRIDMVLDGGPTPGGIESTVLDLTTTPPRLLRPGLLSTAEIIAVIGPISLPHTDLHGPSPSPDEALAAGLVLPDPLPSPGMMERHYAPHAPLELHTRSEARVEALIKQGERVGWLTFSEASEPPPELFCIVMPHDAKAYAARLYAVLHALDAAKVTRIVIETPPTDDAWLAIHDRLRRAATASFEE